MTVKTKFLLASASAFLALGAYSLGLGIKSDFNYSADRAALSHACQVNQAQNIPCSKDEAAADEANKEISMALALGSGLSISGFLVFLGLASGQNKTCSVREKNASTPARDSLPKI